MSISQEIRTIHFLDLALTKKHQQKKEETKANTYLLVSILKVYLSISFLIRVEIKL